MVEQTDDACETLGPFKFSPSLPRAQVAILHRLNNFFTDDIIRQVLLPLINQESNISLRALDWLVTNFAKKHSIVCKRNTGLFNIYHGYKIALSHFRRKNFDPFRRRERISVCVDGMRYDSTVGQCNFIQWAYVNGVLQYAHENYAQIERDMNEASALYKKERRFQGTGRRRELSRAPVAKCAVYNVNSEVKFDTVAASDFALGL